MYFLKDKSQLNDDDYKTSPHFIDVKIPGGKGKCNVEMWYFQIAASHEGGGCYFWDELKFLLNYVCRL